MIDLFEMNSVLKNTRENANTAKELTASFKSHIEKMTPELDRISTQRNYDSIIDLKKNQRKTLEQMTDFAETSKLADRALQGATIILDPYIQGEHGMLTVFENLNNR